MAPTIMSPDKGLHPPQQAWKLLLLLLATVTLYQFAWLYRTAQDLRATRDPSITPWHWALIPLLGPFVFVPGYKLAAYLRDWQVAEDKEPGHLAEPVMVGMLMVVAYLPTLMMIVDTATAAPALLLSSMTLSLSYLMLNGQLNNNKKPVSGQEFRAAPWRFEKRQLWAAAAGSVVAIPLYLILFTNVRENYHAVHLADGGLIRAELANVQVRILDAGWSRVGANLMQADAALEFYGPDDRTWAIVYDYEGWSIDDVLAHRQSAIQEDYSRAKCSQHKSIVEHDWTVLGILECEGRSALEGNYVFASRVLRRNQSVFELVAFTSQNDAARFAEMSPRVWRFAEGLELPP